MSKDLFEAGREKQIEAESPLANRMRPRNLNEYIGQGHILAKGRLLRRAIEADQLSSLIFYGPPGTGKTTLAMVIANTTESHFITLNAVLTGVKDVREAIATADERRNLYGQRTTLFVDEVHRWNKAQQDALLPHVERGTILLIGATTENPYFEVNKALVSRSRIFQLKPLTEDDLVEVARSAIADKERGYGNLPVVLNEDALGHLVDVANGDARGVLNALELAVETTPPNDDGEIVISLTVAEESIQRRAVLYDKDGDAHYDTISAFIKSVRGSDVDAALYWAAKMVYVGEDPRFIFRRLAILASEDIGMADPMAISIVESCWRTFERIGMPEGQFPLAQAVIYLATTKKSNSAFAFFDALNTVQEEQEAGVPSAIKDKNRDGKGFGHGVGYKYPHAYQDHWVAQQYLPRMLQGKLFYQPSDQGYEGSIADEVARRREAQMAVLLDAEEDREVLTQSPRDPVRESWLERTMGETGGMLAQVRERVFELAGVQRHELVLNLNADNGLLLWEAVRSAPEGGVWGVADGEGIARLDVVAEKLLSLDRPELVTSLDEVRESAVRFDKVVAYFGRETAVSMAEMGTLMADRGKMVIAEKVVARGQRIYDLVDWGEETELREQVVRAEESLWGNTDEPKRTEPANGLKKSEILEEVIREERRIAGQVVSQWFGEGAAYRGALEAEGVDVGKVEKLYRAQLSDKVVEWGSLVVFKVFD